MTVDSYDVIRSEFNAGKIDAPGAIRRLVDTGWGREDAEDIIFELQYERDRAFPNGEQR
jgi:hypothetical protein